MTGQHRVKTIQVKVSLLTTRWQYMNTHESQQAFFHTRTDVKQGLDRGTFASPIIRTGMNVSKTVELWKCLCHERVFPWQQVKARSGALPRRPARGGSEGPPGLGDSALPPPLLLIPGTPSVGGSSAAQTQEIIHLLLSDLGFKNIAMMLPVQIQAVRLYTVLGVVLLSCH